MNKIGVPLLLLAGWLGLVPAALAAPPVIKNGGDNGGTTYVDGVTAAGDTIVTYEDSATPANVLNDTSNIVSVTLAMPMVKEIRDLAGTKHPNGIVLAKGQEIYYVIYVWNRTTDQTVTDVRISDALPAGLTYIAGSLQIFNGSVGGDPASAANWTTASNWLGLAWAAQTDATGAGDMASISAGTVSAGLAGNGQVDVNATNVFALRFRVRVN